MQERTLRALLDEVAAGRLAAAEAVERLRTLPFEDLDFAKVDHHRTLRQGAAEVIFGPGKTAAQVAAIAAAIGRQAANLLVTRTTPEAFAAVQAVLPEAVFHARCGAVTVQREAPPAGAGTVLVVAAGTADRAIADEAALTAALLTAPVETLHDVGVAGLQRLLAHLEQLQAARVLVAVAGMEGALPGVIAGLVSAPVIAVPTSIGYGTGLGGAAALLTMLNACAPNVAVVNIDNGFGAGFLAASINRRAGPEPARR